MFPKIKISIDTDVNACAWAEYKRGNHEVSESIAYITVGTGVGLGLVFIISPFLALLQIKNLFS